MNRRYDVLDEPELWSLDEPVYTLLCFSLFGFSISVENRDFSAELGETGTAENSSGFGFNVIWERLRLLENKRDPIKI